MSWMARLETFLNTICPLIEDSNVIERLQLDLDPSGDDFQMTFHFEGVGSFEVQTSWVTPVEDVMSEIREVFQEAKTECKETEENGKKAAASLKKIKLLDPSPLEALAMAADDEGKQSDQDGGMTS